MVPGGYTIPIMVTFIVALMTLADDTEASCYGSTIIQLDNLSTHDKQDIVAVHNQLRQMTAVGLVPTQTKARNMREMFWDDELAKKAQDWANLCPDEKDPSLGEEGQLIFHAEHVEQPPYGSEQRWHIPIYTWFSSLCNCDGTNNAAASNYSQIVWANTYLVGCGYASYKTPKDEYKKRYICNYNTAYKPGVKPYNPGSPDCSAYEMAYSSDYWGLCVKDTATPTTTTIATPTTTTPATDSVTKTKLKW